MILTMPTKPMREAAAAVGRFEDAWGRTYPKLQIITLAELFQGKKPDIPFVDPASVRPSVLFLLPTPFVLSKDDQGHDERDD